MELSPGEKIIITMLADIKNHLKIDGEIDHDFVTKAIYNNHLWALNWRMDGLNFPREESPRHVTQVVDILDMWDMVELSFDNLDQTERDEIEADQSLSRPRFQGFDGNNETEHMSVARFLVEDLNRFSRFEGRDFNSHYPLLERYLRMVEVFESFGHAWVDRDPRGLTKDEISIILKR